MPEREDVGQRLADADDPGARGLNHTRDGDGAGAAVATDPVTGTTAVGADETGAAPEARPPIRRRLTGRGEGPRLGWILAVCCVAQFMTILDLSIVNVALPSIQSSLNFSQAGLQWVVDAYAIVFAGFLMLGGRLADQLGQRRVFVAALALFALASLAGGAAQSRSMLTIARGAQGLGGALMAASSLAIITSSFPAGPARHRAIGLWAAMNGAGGAAGTLFGGIITQEISWRWVLLINPPIAIVAALVAFTVVSDRRGERREGSFDFGGALTLTLGQIVLVYGVVQAGLRGWHSANALIPIIGGLAILMAFNVIELRFARAPLIPFKDLTKPVAIANGIVVLFSAALFPMWFVSSLYLQQVLGLSPLHAGLTFLPMALMIMVTASQAGKLVGRFGVRAVLCSGLVMMTGGLLLFTKIAASGSAAAYVIIPGLLTAAGIALSIVPSTIFATQGAKEGQAGLVSGLVNTSRQAGGGIGIALLITLATQQTTHLIGAGHAVPQALTDGFRLAYYIGAGFTAVAAIATFLWAPRPPAAAEAVRRRVPALAAAVVAVIGLFVAVSFAAGGTHAPPIGAYTTAGAQSFVSAPSLHPPKLTARAATNTGRLAPGYIFMGNMYDLTAPPIVGQSGPIIFDNHLQPVWFKPVPQDVIASNLSRQTYNGKPALSWWQGTITNTGETLKGEDVIVNQHYQPVATLKGADGWILTVHELLIDGDHAWVTANKNLPMDLSKYGGAYNGALVDSAVQEYDIKTGRLLYNWDALKHIPLSESIASLPTNGFPWDAYHVNSIDLLPNGGFVVSMRSTWAVYLVDKSGHIAWTLGGRNSSYKFAPAAQFAWQHDVVLHPGSILSMFDDHCCQITGGGTYVSPTAASRGLILKLDQATHTAKVVAQYPHNDNFDAQYMGSTQPLPNGNVLVGWGSQPYLSEYAGSGKQLLDASLPSPDLSYRATLEQWVGLPLSPPAGAARRGAGGQTTVYASWNGATQVASWRVLDGGTSPTGRAALAAATKSGFETAIRVPPGHTTFKVEALDAGGRVIGTSGSFTAA